MPKIPRFLRTLTLAFDALLLLLLILSQFTTPHLWLWQTGLSSTRDYLLLAFLPKSYTTFTFESPLPWTGLVGLFRTPEVARSAGITYCILPWWLLLLTTALLSALLFWTTTPHPSTTPAFPLAPPPPQNEKSPRQPPEASKLWILDGIRTFFKDNPTWDVDTEGV